MSDDIFSFDLDEGADELTTNVKRFKPETGVTYRVSFVWFHDRHLDDGVPKDDAPPAFGGAKRTKYKQGLGCVLLPKDDPDTAKEILRLTGMEEQKRVASVICLWPCNREGDLLTSQIKEGKGWKVVPWVFDMGKYEEIKRIHKRTPLGTHDLSMTCTDGQFHKMTFIGENNSVMRKYMGSENEVIQTTLRKILTQAKAIGNNINNELGRSMTLDQIRESMGKAVAPSGGDNHTDENVDNLLDDVL